MNNKKALTLAAIVIFGTLEALALEPIAFFSTNIMLNVGSLLVVFAAAICFGILLFKKWKANFWMKVSVAIGIIIASDLFALWVALYMVRYSLMMNGIR